jgi:sugar lactone lactonase YvrE
MTVAKGNNTTSGKYIIPITTTADNTLTTSFTGRYVRIKPSAYLGDGLLNIAQIIVTNSAGTNLASGKFVYASNTAAGSGSSKLLTNGTTTIPTSASNVLTTTTARSDYIEVDLEASYAITSVRVIMMAGYTASNTVDRTSQTRIEINADTDAAAKAGYATAAASAANDPSKGKFIIPPRATTADNTVITNFTGRYVRIRPAVVRGDGYLQLAQLIVNDSAGKNIALGKPVYASSTSSGQLNISSIVNGTMTPASIGANLWFPQTTNRATEFAEVDLGASYNIASVRLLQLTSAVWTEHISVQGDNISETRIEINADTGAAEKASYDAQIAKIQQASAAASAAVSGAASAAQASAATVSAAASAAVSGAIFIGNDPSKGKFIIPAGAKTADNTVTTNFTGRYIRIRPSLNLGDGYIGMTQLIVNDSAGKNLALGKLVYATSTYPNQRTSASIVNGRMTVGDGTGSDMWHAASNNRATEFFEVDLGASVAVASVRLLQNPNTTSTNTSNDRTSQTRIEINADSDAAAKASYAAQIAEVLQASAAVSGAVVVQKSMQVTTLAGTGVADYAEGAGASAKFNDPCGIIVDSTGNVYVADGNHRIRKITPTGVVSTFAGSGFAALLDGTGTAAQFNRPYGMTIDAANNIYVTDRGNNAIRKITPAGVVTTIDKNYSYPLGCAVDSAGNVYVTDTWNQKIKKITPAGVMSVIAGTGAVGGLDGPGDRATFADPSDVAVHPTTGELYVADCANHKVRKISAAGVVSTVAGTGVTGGNDGPVLSATFNRPATIKFDSAGNLYVGEQGAGRIRVITPNGYVQTYSGSSPGFANNVTADLAQFNWLSGIALDSAGNIYVADTSNHRIRMILTPDSQIGRIPY